MLRRLPGYLVAVAGPVAITAGVLWQRPSSSASAAGYAYLYLGAITLVALLWGLGPAVVAAVVSAGLLDYFLVPPVGRLSIESPQDVENVVLFLVAAMVVGLLAVARRRQEERARDLAESLRASNRELDRRRAEAEEGRRTAVELARLSARVDALDEADRLKTELLANVSHELRTPLGAIVGMSSALVEGVSPADSDQARQYAETILSEGRHLSRLVDDLLQMAGLEAEVGRVQLDAVDSLEALESAAERAKLFRPESSVLVSGEHFLALADDARLQGILRNLIDNAAIYGGTVELSCQRAGGMGRFEVADRGPGIPPEELDAVFERFHRVTPAGGPRTAGSGLGLAICRRLVESMAGTIGCENRPGGGAVFRFDLPLFDPGGRA